MFNFVYEATKKKEHKLKTKKKSKEQQHGKLYFRKKREIG